MQISKLNQGHSAEDDQAESNNCCLKVQTPVLVSTGTSGACTSNVHRQGGLPTLTGDSIPFTDKCD